MLIEKIGLAWREGVAVFVVRFAVQEERFEVVCDAATILDYSSLQRHVLAQTGRVFLFAAAEGREPAAANQSWHDELHFLIEAEARRAAETLMGN